MKKVIILQILIALFFVIAGSAYPEDKITILNDELSSLDKQKQQLESEKLVLVNEGDELSFKIEELKRHSDSGLGIIGRFKLSHNLRKAQRLSEDTQNLDRKILTIKKQINDKKALLVKEYELQINSFIQKLSSINNMQEKKAFLEKIREYQSSASQLRESEKQELETIDITKLDIKEHDSPKEIREKSDLIIDVANKTNARISIIESRIVNLKDELKTREKLDEFADEISFFGERVAKGEVVSKSDKEPIVATSKTETNTGNTFSDDKKSDTETAEPIIRTGNPTTLDDPDSITTEPLQTGELSVRSVIKSKTLSAELSRMPQSRLEEELVNLEKQRQDLKNRLMTLTDKANSFRKRAEQLEKTGTKNVETKNVNPRKQDAKSKQQKNEDKAKP